MKTKELIEILQKEDPSGEAHIRFYNDGVPMSAVSKPGYWDGPYTYINDNGNYVLSTKGDKVDIYCMDIWDFVEENMRRDTKWEEIENKFKFELEYLNEEHNKEKSESILKKAKEAFDEIKSINTQLYEESLSKMIENAKKGWCWFQNMNVDKNEVPNMHIYYTWKIYDEKGKEQSSNIHHTESIQLSGLWKKVVSKKKNGYYEWIFKN